jgi:putative phosphotransacetylase
MSAALAGENQISMRPEALLKNAVCGDLLKRHIALALAKELARQHQYYVPAAASSRHVHLSGEALEILFGSGYRLKVLRPLTQPGQFACEETVTLAGPRGRIQGVRILGPVRSETQVEISLTDTYRLGIEPVVRMSGDIGGSPGCTLVGPAGEVVLGQGVIVAARHLHISDEEAEAFGLKNGDTVAARKKGDRETVFGNILVRAGDAHSLELHLDTDEANTARIQNGDLLELIKQP